MKKRHLSYLIPFLALIMVLRCKDPLPLETFDYEDLLVVETTMTNEVKQQEIKLTRTTSLDTSDIRLENNAEVYVVENNGMRYNFSQGLNGTYLSQQKFGAVTGSTYQLFINTQNGRSYTSAPVSPLAPPNLKNIYAEKGANPEGKTGIQVLADVEGNAGSPFFRFEYEETYKIKTPFPSPLDFDVKNYTVDDDGYISFDVETTSNPRQETICYSTKQSADINIAASTALDTNQLLRKPILFLYAGDPKIQQRYSVLVKAYSESQSSYTFYKNLKELGSNDDFLSQKQPGFIVGNIVSLTDENEKVLGFFDVSLQTQKRIFFDYSDFGLPEPPYFFNCVPKVLDYNDNTTLDRDPNEREEIYGNLQFGGYNILERIFVNDVNEFTLISGQCSDCTTFSSNKKPDFWED